MCSNSKFWSTKDFLSNFKDEVSLQVKHHFGCKMFNCQNNAWIDAQVSKALKTPSIHCVLSLSELVFTSGNMLLLLTFQASTSMLLVDRSSTYKSSTSNVSEWGEEKDRIVKKAVKIEFLVFHFCQLGVEKPSNTHQFLQQQLSKVEY